MFELKNIKEYVNAEKDKLKEEIKTFKTQPILAIFQIVNPMDNNEASNRYIRNKIKDCNEVGIKTVFTKYSYMNTKGWDHAIRDVFIDGVNYFDGGISILEHNSVVAQIEYDISYVKSNGTIIQLPIHKDIEIDDEIIDDEKDVDGFNKNSLFKPATALGIINYLEYCKYPFKGKNAVIINRSKIVGKPLAKMLLDKDMTVTVCHSKTDKNDLEKYLNTSDLIITAVGKPNFLDISNYPNKTIIDVGINFNNNGKLVGDCYSKYNDNRYNNCTPVPNGVGIITRLQLLKNVVKAYKYQNGVE